MNLIDKVFKARRERNVYWSSRDEGNLNGHFEKHVTKDILSLLLWNKAISLDEYEELSVNIVCDPIEYYITKYRNTLKIHCFRRNIFVCAKLVGESLLILTCYVMDADTKKKEISKLQSSRYRILY